MALQKKRDKPDTDHALGTEWAMQGADKNTYLSPSRNAEPTRIDSGEVCEACEQHIDTTGFCRCSE